MNGNRKRGREERDANDEGRGKTVYSRARVCVCASRARRNGKGKKAGRWPSRERVVVVVLSIRNVRVNERRH